MRQLLVCRAISRERPGLRMELESHGLKLKWTEYGKRLVIKIGDLEPCGYKYVLKTWRQKSNMFLPWIEGGENKWNTILHIFIVFNLGTKFLSFEPVGTEKSSKDYVTVLEGRMKTWFQQWVRWLSSKDACCTNLSIWVQFSRPL